MKNIGYMGKNIYFCSQVLCVMKKFIVYILSIICLFSLSSCNKSEVVNPEPPVEENQHTLLVYMPWSTNLLSAFYQNIEDLMKAINQVGLQNQKVLIFLADSHVTAKLYEVEKSTDAETVGDVYVYREKKNYNFTAPSDGTPEYTTVRGLTTILSDMITMAPAKKYSMIVGCHGSGWMPVSRAATRSFGGTSNVYQTEISSLREAIQSMNKKFEYILFDDCYMANVEVAYELKDVTDYLIASTCEIMSYGMPYHTMGRYLLGNPDYAKVCSEFFKFYSSYTSPYGTISVASTKMMDNVAKEMRNLNQKYTFDVSNLDNIQYLDGYYPHIFFDMGDYVTNLTNDQQASAQLMNYLQLAVPYKSNTTRFFSALSGRRTDIDAYSGLTISDPSENKSDINQAKKESTSWWKATH